MFSSSCLAVPPVCSHTRVLLFPIHVPEEGLTCFPVLRQGLDFPPFVFLGIGPAVSPVCSQPGAPGCLPFVFVGRDSCVLRQRLCGFPPVLSGTGHYCVPLLGRRQGSAAPPRCFPSVFSSSCSAVSLLCPSTLGRALLLPLGVLRQGLWC